MSQSTSVKKAETFRKQVRREQLEKIFKEKRSNMDKQRKQLMAEMGQKLGEEATNAFDSEYDIDEICQQWKMIKVIIEKFSSCLKWTQSNNESQTYRNQLSRQFGQRMTKMCSMVSQVIKQLNEYIELTPKKIHPLLQQETQPSLYSLQPRRLSQQLYQMMALICQIYQECSTSLLQLFEQLNVMVSNESGKGVITVDLERYLHRVNLLVEISCLKREKVGLGSSNGNSPVVKGYKKLEIYEKLSDMVEQIKQRQIKQTYPTCLALLQMLSKGFRGNHDVKYLNSINNLSNLNSHENCNIKIRSNNKTYETKEEYLQQITLGNIIASLLYTTGNIMSEYQPNTLLSQYQSLSHNQALSKNSSKIIPSQISLQVFVRILELIEGLKQELLREMERNIDKLYDGIKQLLESKIQIFNLHSTVVEIQCWFSRLLIVGGWLANQPVDSISNTYTSEISNKSSTINFILIKSPSTIQSIICNISLLQSLNISPHKYITYSFQHISELLLICELTVSEALTQLQFQSNKIVSNSLVQSIQIPKPPSIQLGGVLQLTNEIPKLVKWYLTTNCSQTSLYPNTSKSLINNKKQIIIDDLFGQLISLLQTLLSFSYTSFHLTVSYNQNEINHGVLTQIQQFILECLQSQTLCSSILSLPISILKHHNSPQHSSLFSPQQNSKHHNILYNSETFPSLIYSQFAQNVQFILPIIMYSKHRMIEQEDDLLVKIIKNTNGEVDWDLIGKKLVSQSNQERGKVLYYFIQSLPLRKQQQFYHNHILLLTQAYIFYQKQATSTFQKSLSQRHTHQQPLSSYYQQVFSTFCQQQSSIYQESIGPYQSSQSFSMFPPLMTPQYLNKLFYLIVDKFTEFSSLLHVDTLKLIKLVLATGEEQTEQFVKSLFTQNVHGVRQYFEAISQSQNQEIYQLVMEVFDLLEIEQ